MDVESVYAEYFNDICRYAYSRCRNWHLAEDITSDVFLNLVKNDYSVSNIKSYLCTSVYNKLIEYYKSGHYELVSIDVALEVCDGGLSDLDIDNQALLSEVFKLTEQKLTDVQRKIISMRFIEEFSLPEIAEMLELKENNVKQIQFRTLARLREMLNVSVIQIPT